MEIKKEKSDSSALIIAVWVKNDTKDFENNVPLLEASRIYEKKGIFDKPINIVFLEGFYLLNKDYLKLLKNAGYILHDATEIYKNIDIQYSNLNKFGNYEKKCFLRWLIIEKLFSDKYKQLICIDGDVLLNEKISKIFELVKGLTFVVQGCPAFVSIYDKTWFCSYKKELDKFAENIDKYSEIAWDQRNNWEISEKQKWAGQRFRKIISSDQDLISHLIHKDLIPQSLLSNIKTKFSKYEIFENPLYLLCLTDNAPYIYFRKNNFDYLQDNRNNLRKVLFWHLQGAFKEYLQRARVMRFFQLQILIDNINECEKISTINFCLKMFNSNFFLKRERKHLYKYFFKENNLRFIMNKKVWWDKKSFK